MDKEPRNLRGTNFFKTLFGSKSTAPNRGLCRSVKCYYKWLRKGIGEPGYFPSLSLMIKVYRAVRDRSDQSNVSIPCNSIPRRSQAKMRRQLRSIFLVVGSVLIGSASLAIVGGLSKFHPGDSTKAQRAWTMSWLAAGIAVGPISYFFPTITSLLLRDPLAGILWKFCLLLYATPAMGGFFIVS